MITKNSYENFITGLAVTFIALLVAFGIVVVTRASVSPLSERVSIGDGFIQVGDRATCRERQTWE